MRVLVIEDEPDLLRVVVQALREAGYAVEEAADGPAGLARAAGEEYDAIVLDWMLPQMDGLSVLRELRRAKTTPVVILTARDAIEDRVTGLDAGADDYLTKPFELPELLARVRALIRRGAGGAVLAPQLGEVTRDSLARTLSKLGLARQIQMGLTPREPPRVAGVEVAFHYEPAQWVGGDYCDLWKLADGRLAFVVADVCGKGLGAALVMAYLHAALHAGTEFCAGPAEAVAYVDRHLQQHLPEGMFVTLFLGVLDAATGRLEYVNAGHVPPLVAAPGAPVAPLGRPLNPVLGVASDGFVAEQQVLRPGACVLAVTDGVTETLSPQGREFGIRGVQAVLEQAEDRNAAQVVAAVREAAARFRGAAPRQDDVTVVGVRWTGVADRGCQSAD